MPTVKSKGIHTSPQTAGKKNLPKNINNTDKDNINAMIMPVMLHGNKKGYTGLWSDEELAKSIADFFCHCADNVVKPTVPLLRLWLNVTQTTLLEWRNHPERYLGKSDIIKKSMDYMECYLQAQIDKYPTGSIFLLKTTHGHIEGSRLDITSNGKSLGSTSSEVNEELDRLGFIETE